VADANSGSDSHIVSGGGGRTLHADEFDAQCSAICYFVCDQTSVTFDAVKEEDRIIMQPHHVWDVLRRRGGRAQAEVLES